MLHDLFSHHLMVPPFNDSSPLIFWVICGASVLLMAIAKSGFGGAVASLSAPHAHYSSSQRNASYSFAALSVDGYLGDMDLAWIQLLEGAVMDGCVWRDWSGVWLYSDQRH